MSQVIPTRFVRSLSPGERKSLRFTARHARDARLANRARAVLMSDRKFPPSRIADILEVSHSWVIRWIERYEAYGLEGLHDRPRAGRPRKATAAFEKRLLELVQTEPRQLNPSLPWTVWTVFLLGQRLEQEGFAPVSDDTIRRALHRHEVAFLRPKLDLHHKQDPIAVAGFLRRLRRVKRGFWRQSA